MDYPSLIMREREEKSEPDYYRAGSQLVRFLSAAYFHFSTHTDDISIYRDYVEWVVSRIMGRRLDHEPLLLEAAANVIKQTIAHSKSADMNDLPEDAVNFAFYR